MTITPAPGRVGSLYYLKGDKQQFIARNLDLSDGEAAQQAVDNARHNYPTQALKLAVYRKNGTARILVETLDVSQPALAGADSSEEMTNVATRPAPAAPGLPPGLDNMTSYLLMMSNNQVVEKDNIIFDLREDKKRFEARERELEKKIDKLQFELDGKDREHQYALRDAVASQPKGLAGIGEVMNQLPPDLLTMIASRILGPAPAAAPAAPVAQLGSHLTDGQRQVIQYLTDAASESEEKAVKIYSIISQGLNNAQGLDQLIAFCSTTFPQLRAA